MKVSLLENKTERISDVHQRLAKVLSPLEKLRLDVRKRSKIVTFSLLISILLLVGLFILCSPSYYIPIVIGIVTAIGYYFFYRSYLGKYQTELSESFYGKVVPTIINEFMPKATVAVNLSIGSDDYWASRLFSSRVDRYEGKNLVGGVFGQTKVKFSELHTQYKTETQTKNGTRTTWHTIFDGIFMIADCNKMFKGETLIFPDSAESLFGGVGKWIQEKLGSIGKGAMIYLENSVFEKKFVVYATDPVEARYLLTPSMQQYIVDLHTHICNRKLHISFIGGQVYLGISGYSNLFDLKMNKAFDDINTIEYYTKKLLHILSVIEILDLNTRIWGK